MPSNHNGKPSERAGWLMGNDPKQKAAHNGGQ